MKKSALGKGLNALIPDSYSVKKNDVPATNQTEQSQAPSQTGILSLSVDKIIPNPDQPRTLFDDDKLTELAASIKEKGIIQPIIVKKIADQDKFELVCGERRWKASQIAGLQTIPALVKDFADDALLDIALIENIQREDLNPIEEAHGYKKLTERGFSPEEIAQKVGRNRTTVTNTLRLLKLPDDIITLILEGQLSEGHARALLSLPTPEYQRRLAKRAVEENLSVRQIEEIVKKKAYQKRPAKQLRKIDAQILDLERKLEEKLGSKVRIFAGKSKGRIEVRYFGLDELDRILSVLDVKVD